MNEILKKSFDPIQSRIITFSGPEADSFLAGSRKWKKNAKCSTPQRAADTSVRRGYVSDKLARAYHSSTSVVRQIHV